MFTTAHGDPPTRLVELLLVCLVVVEVHRLHLLVPPLDRPEGLEQPLTVQALPPAAAAAASSVTTTVASRRVSVLLYRRAVVRDAKQLLGTQLIQRRMFSLLRVWIITQ